MYTIHINSAQNHLHRHCHKHHHCHSSFAQEFLLFRQGISNNLPSLRWQMYKPLRKSDLSPQLKLDTDAQIILKQFTLPKSSITDHHMDCHNPHYFGLTSTLPSIFLCANGEIKSFIVLDCLIIMEIGANLNSSLLELQRLGRVVKFSSL